MATWDEERLKVENEVMKAMVDFLNASGIHYKSDIGYLEFPRPMVPEDEFKKIVEKAESKLKELGYENYNVFETAINVSFPEQIEWYEATFSSRASSSPSSPLGQEVREGMSGVLTRELKADDLQGFTHTLPAGTRIHKVHSVTSTYVSFGTVHPVDSANVFVALPLAFRESFRPEGSVRAQVVGKKLFRVWFTTPIGFERFVNVEAADKEEARRLAERQVPAGSEWRGTFEISSYTQKAPSSEVERTSTTCPVCNSPVAGGPEKYLGHIRTKHPDEWRKLETDPSYSLRRAEAGILRCQYCGAPYLYRENLELHERGCPRRTGY